MFRSAPRLGENPQLLAMVMRETIDITAPIYLTPIMGAGDKGRHYPYQVSERVGRSPASAWKCMAESHDNGFHTGRDIQEMPVF